jgi:hypothetical protein
LKLLPARSIQFDVFSPQFVTIWAELVNSNARSLPVGNCERFAACNLLQLLENPYESDQRTSDFLHLLLAA